MTITGYTYKANNYCPQCIVETMIAAGEASPGARAMPVEAVLDQCAGANAIAREDERSFDSFDFPKVIFSDRDGGIACGRCGKKL